METITRPKIWDKFGVCHIGIVNSKLPTEFCESKVWASTRLPSSALSILGSFEEWCGCPAEQTIT